MRVLFIVDIHGDLESVKRLKKAVSGRGIELVVICGDLTQGGSGIRAQAILDELKDWRVLAVPGNMDSEEVEAVLEKGQANLNKKRVEVKGISFIGLGGGKPVHTYYRYNVGELEAKKYLKKLFEGVEGKKAVVVSHVPPSGTRVELTASGARLGLKALRDAIEENQPLLSVCGHVHEAKGEDSIGKTKVINIGPVMHGNAVIIDLPEMKIERIEF